METHKLRPHFVLGSFSLLKRSSNRDALTSPVLLTLILTFFVFTVIAPGRATSRRPGQAESRGQSNEYEGLLIDHSSALRATLDPNRYDQALEQWRRLPRASPFGLATVGFIGGTVWKPIGPNPIIEQGCCGSSIKFAASGRVNSIAVDPTDSNVIYLGSAGGGVWKSVDHGSHWKPMTDQEVSLGIGSSHAIAIDPSHPNTIYAGTSSWSLLNPNDRSQSRGILKSTDGGESWLILGSGIPSGNTGNATQHFNGRNISTIIVDPTNSNLLYAAAGRADDLIAGGVYRSTDGGLNWTQGLGTEELFVESLVLDTSSSAAMRTLYAGALGKGVLKSTNGGASWAFLLTPTTPVVAAAAPAGIVKTMVALAPVATPANPAGPVIYASVQVRDGDRDLTTAIFENTNGGAEVSWVKKNAQVIAFSNGFSKLEGAGFSDMIVDPASPGDGVNDSIYWGGLSQFLSTDSGSTFNEIGQINGTHGDHQTWVVVPQDGTLYVGDDGGIWRSDDRGASWTGTSLTGFGTTINAGGLQTATLYQLAIKQDASASVTVAGTQDSGVLRLPLFPAVPSLPPGSLPWSGTSVDGIDVAFDKDDVNIAYVIENTAFKKSTDSGTTWSTDFTSKLPSSQISIFRNRLAVDPNNAGFFYVGGSAGEVLQTIDGAATNFRSLGILTPAFVTSIDVAPGNSNHVVAASGRQVFVTTRALDTTLNPSADVIFQDITGDLPSRFVTRVAFDPNNPELVYATLAGYGGGHVFRKTITEANWTDISPAVDIPVNAIALDGGSNTTVLYVGTDLGVLRRSVADGAAWEVVDDLHLPNAAVSDLEINTQAGVLRAGTWGRGVFELAAPSGPVISVSETRLSFGPTCAITGADQSIHVSSAGMDNLIVSSVQRIAGSSSFTVLLTPSTPLSIAPGEGATFTVHYTPTVPGVVESAIIRVSSNDPLVPFVDLVATGSLEITPPSITSVNPTPNVLRPPNHKMAPVTVSVAVTDNCDSAVSQSCTIISVTSNEPISGTGEGDTAPDWEITGNLTLRLRAERAGSGTGRTYTILVQCTDNAGNRASRSTTVTVPHP